MANKAPNLKVNVGADTSQFTKGMKEAKQELNAFSKATTGIGDKIASAFGVPMDKLRGFSDALKGAARSAEQAGTKGAGAMKAIAAAAGGAGTAIAAIGLGAAVTAFKLLSAEAENFKNTWNGLEMAAGLDAYVDTYKQAFHDMNATIGEQTADLGATLKKKWTEIWQGAKNVAIKIFTGKDIATAVSETAAQSVAAGAVAKQAEELKKNLVAVQKSYVGEGMGTDKEGLSTKLVRLDSERARWQKIAYDRSVAAQDRAAAMAKVVELINEKYDLQISYQTRVADLTRSIANLTGSTFEQMQAATNEENKLLQLEGERNQALRELSRTQATITKAVEEEKKAALNSALNQAGEDISMQIDLDIATTASELADDTNEIIEAAGADVQPFNLDIEPNIDVEKIKDVFIDMQSAVSEFAASAASALGELVGDLATGGDAWGNFGNAVVATFADMAISIGKIAVGTGIAALGIQKIAIDPTTAIIAGTALIALGAAAKAAMSNVVNSGSYSANSSVATSGYSTTSPISGIERTLTIDVTGTLKADGSQLVAVLNNENNRKNLTT